MQIIRLKKRKYEGERNPESKQRGKEVMAVFPAITLKNHTSMPAGVLPEPVLGKMKCITTRPIRYSEEAMANNR